MNKLFKHITYSLKWFEFNTYSLTNYIAFRISISELIENINDRKRKPITYQNKNIELKNVLQDSINKLPAMHRAVFLKKTIDKCKTNDICEELGITRTTFWKIIHEARLKLINDLEDKKLI